MRIVRHLEVVRGGKVSGSTAHWLFRVSEVKWEGGRSGSRELCWSSEDKGRSSTGSPAQGQEGIIR